METITESACARMAPHRASLGPLALRVLRTPAQRAAIARLRCLSPAGVEDDLGLQLRPFEAARDEAGVVAALCRGEQVIATIRFVPSGQGLTGAERLSERLSDETDFLGPGNWEVGRLVVDPQERDPALLGRCLALALVELVRTREVENFYAIATPTMARLWRRFGMRVAAHVQGSSGAPYVVVRGHVTDVAAALSVPTELPRARRQRPGAFGLAHRARHNQAIPA